jgi:two-component system NarL family sensor kinase
MLDEFGLVDVLRWYVRGFSRRSRIDVTLTCDPRLGRFPRDIELAMFRVVQEALNNVRQHSGTRRAHIRLALRNRSLVLDVKDFGRGISSSRTSQPIETLGVGIAGMRKRIQQFGGELEIQSTKKGTLLRGVLPIAKAA